jgi:hypothetical protein
LKLLNEDIYNGNLQLDKFHGKGKYISHTKQSIFDGEWLDGIKHGSGKIIDICGRVHSGYWNNGKKDGRFDVLMQSGRIEHQTYKNGTKLTGVF